MPSHPAHFRRAFNTRPKLPHNEVMSPSWSLPVLVTRLCAICFHLLPHPGWKHRLSNGIPSPRSSIRRNPPGRGNQPNRNRHPRTPAKSGRPTERPHFGLLLQILKRDAFRREGLPIRVPGHIPAGPECVVRPGADPAHVNAVDVEDVPGAACRCFHTPTQRRNRSSNHCFALFRSRPGSIPDAARQTSRRPCSGPAQT